MAEERVETRGRSAGPQYPTEDISLWMTVETHLLSSKSDLYIITGCLRAVASITLVILVICFLILKTWDDLNGVFIIAGLLLAVYSIYSFLKSYSYFIQTETNITGNIEKRCHCCSFFRQKSRICNCCCKQSITCTANTPEEAQSSASHTRETEPNTSDAKTQPGTSHDTETRSGTSYTPEEFHSRTSNEPNPKRVQHSTLIHPQIPGQPELTDDRIPQEVSARTVTSGDQIHEQGQGSSTSSDQMAGTSTSHQPPPEPPQNLNSVGPSVPSHSDPNSSSLYLQRQAQLRAARSSPQNA